MSVSQMPKWEKPEGEKTGIFVENSLTKKDEEIIIPKENPPRTVNVYTCGPTVYDMSHLGHARSYIGFDIVRRIMEDYFHINVNFIVNVTDIEDKIIAKANRNLLIKLANNLKEILEKKKASKETTDYVAQVLKRIEEDRKAVEREKQMTTTEMVQTIQELKSKGKNEGLLSEEQVQEEPAFLKVPRHYEAEFWKDMKRLNVKFPTVITRVTEYVPEIIAFIQKIIDNGFAYESQGSVYFDTVKFMNDGFNYGKLEPWNVGNSELLGEGEGEWSSGQKKVVEKKCKNDFALWKKSNVGEPSWDSPWSKGRPGWHIECSAMASQITGMKLDIHCGGVDLRFPHHDNEIAQSEAHFKSHQWVNYFFHTGHLSIDGKSMSKSKKNFITIQEALENFDARHIRMLFLNYKFKDPMEYSKSTMNEAVQLYERFNNFFKIIQAMIRDHDEGDHGVSGLPESWGEQEFTLYKSLVEKKNAIHTCLSHNFDTKASLLHLLELVNLTNSYLQENEKRKPRVPLLRQVAEYITKIFRVFGLIDNVDDIGFPVGSSGSGDYKNTIKPFINTLSTFRDEIRTAAREKKSPAVILDLCDKVRDDTLPVLGVRLEDRPNGMAIWDLEDPESVKRKVQRRKEEKEEKERKKAELAKKREEEAKKKLEQSKIAPQDMFKSDAKYVEFDEKGIPTKLVDEKGETKPVSKSQRKKLESMYDKQSILHKKYLEQNGQETTPGQQ